jgi:hypothetical protein
MTRQQQQLQTVSWVVVAHVGQDEDADACRLVVVGKAEASAPMSESCVLTVY